MKTAAELYEELTPQLEENRVAEGDYCVIVYEVYQRGFLSIKTRLYVYRNFEEFIEKYDNDVKDINESMGIYVEWVEFQ